MRATGHATLVAATAVFLVAGTAANVGVAGMYSQGVARLRAAGAIGEHDVRIFTRPIRLAVGDAFPRSALEDHLRHIGYYRVASSDPGCYISAGEALTVWARYPEFSSATIRWDGDTVAAISDADGAPLQAAAIEPERILTLSGDASASSTRASSDPIPLAALIDTPLLDAIIASEDRGFLTHHGLDFPRLALVPLAGGGGSTITMQVARLNVLQDRSRTLQRKVMEIGVAMAMERRFSKAEILTAYVNSVYLGAIHGRVLHGFGAAARELFNVHDVRELAPLQAVTLVALLNQPSRYLEQLFAGDDTRLRRQRNRVLRLMHRADPARYPADWVRGLENQPVVLYSGASDNVLHRSSRYYLDLALGGAARNAGRIYLTLDPALQRIAGDAVEQGLSDLGSRFARFGRRRPQAALIVTNPSTGDVLAMVGGRSYDESQFNRAISAERQVGSIMKPFDYLAAFERAADEGRGDIGAASVVIDQPTEFRFPGLRPWKPANYGNDYGGAVTWRRALAESRNVAAVKVAAWAGIDRVAALWQAASGQRLGQVYPSMTLGAIQATPAEVARAYAMFATGGTVRQLRTAIDLARTTPTGGAQAGALRVARPETTAAVREMMRAVLDEGTARSARAAGFTIDAAGKTGTTDDLRDAWFAGFAGDLLAVVWVGYDGGHSLGLTGAQAALPIWTAFMKRALRVS